MGCQFDGEDFRDHVHLSAVGSAGIATHRTDFACFLFK